MYTINQKTTISILDINYNRNNAIYQDDIVLIIICK